MTAQGGADLSSAARSYRRLCPGLLAELVGPQVAHELMRNWGGERVPRLTRRRRRLLARNDAVRAALNVPGATVRSVARRFRISHARVVQIGKGAR